jgi:hypothetical protein
VQGESSYTDQAAATMLDAVRNEHDFAGWLAGVLARTACELGSSDALTAGRPGSWEADLVRRLVQGTVGWDDECLDAYAKDPSAPDRQSAR